MTLSTLIGECDQISARRFCQVGDRQRFTSLMDQIKATRATLFRECDQIRARSFTQAGDRERFDSLMDQIDAADRLAPSRTDWTAYRQRTAPRTSVVPLEQAAPEPAPPERPAPRPEATSVEGRRRLLADQIRELSERGWYPDGGVIVAGQSYTALGVLRFLERAPAGYLDDIQRQANDAEDRGFQRAERDAADQERAARLDAWRDRAQTEAEEAAQREILEAALADAEAQQTLDARLSRVEALLQRVADGLERRP